MNGRSNRSWIQVGESRGHAGKYFPLAPRAEDIEIKDVARALSNQCRYAGHVARFYSVAEHSVRVSRIVYERTSDPELALWGLLHDASEAYLTDIPRPLKIQPAFAEYRRLEKLNQAAICERFSLSLDEPEIVREIDAEILGTEAEQLKQPIHPDWTASVPGGLKPALPIGTLGWDPRLAEEMFLARFYHLCVLTSRKRELPR